MGRLVWTVVAAACVACSPRANAQCMPYAPNEVELRGRLRATEQYGPPNYGENPESDQRLRVLVLTLDKPIDTCADSSSEINNEAVTGVGTVQILVVPGLNLEPLIGQLVTLRGVLSRAVLARHFTPVVFTVVGDGRSPKT